MFYSGNFSIDWTFIKFYLRTIVSAIILLYHNKKWIFLYWQNAVDILDNFDKSKIPVKNCSQSWHKICIEYIYMYPV